MKLLKKILFTSIIFIITSFGAITTGVVAGNVFESTSSASLPVHTSGIITVCDSGCDYSTIQEAINASQNGDTILVERGTYPESPDIIKPLTIRGVNGTVLVGCSDKDYAFLISSNSVTLENLSVSSSQGNAIQIEGNVTHLKNLIITNHSPDDYNSPVIYGSSLSGIIIENCTSSTSGRYGFTFLDCSNILIQNSSLSLQDPETLNIGIDIAQKNLDFPGFNISVLNNQIEGGGISIGTINKRDGEIIFPEMENVDITNNFIRNTSHWGIDTGGLEDNNQFHMHNFRVNNNQVKGTKNAYTNIRIRSISNGQFRNNSITDFPVNGDGVSIQNLDQFLIENNAVSDGTINPDSGWAGFAIEEVRNSVIRNITLTNVIPYAYGYSPGPYFEPNLSFDTTNTADGKPVIYLEGLENQVITRENNPSMIVLMSCRNSSIVNTTLQNTNLGIGVYNCENSYIFNNTLKNSLNGMMLINSADSIVVGNTYQNMFMALGVGNNRNTEIKENHFLEFVDSGIVIHTDSSHCLNITKNIFTGIFEETDQAIVVSSANGASIQIADNSISQSTRGVLIQQSSNFLFTNNSITDSGIGFNLLAAQENQFIRNTIQNTEDNSEGFTVTSTNALGGGISENNFFIDNYISSEIPVNVSFIEGTTVYSLQNPERWGLNSWMKQVLSTETFPNTWNTSKSAGPNIVAGPYIGGNYYATPNGSGWSQTHADRGDGFVNEPYVFDANNTDFLPLHIHNTPTPTPTPTPQPITASFIGTPRSGTPSLPVQFTDTSTGTPTSWNWSFGDGTISYEQNPVHTYSGIGRYTVTLKIANGAGQSIIREPSYIYVHSGRVIGPSGGLWMTSQPSGATVKINGDLLGGTPLQITGIPAGMHQFTVSYDGYESWTKNIVVQANQMNYIPRIILKQA